MAHQKTLTDEQIELFLSLSDKNDEYESDLSESGSDIEVDQEESVADTSSSDESTDADEDDIPLNILRAKSNIITCDKVILRGKNGHKWSSIKGTTHHYGLNIVHKTRGPTSQCKNKTDPFECFTQFITKDIVDEIVQWTNVEITSRQSNLLENSDKAQRRNTTATEIYAILGILVLTAVKKDQHLSVEELFDRSYCGSKYISITTKARFKFLMSCLRFDDKSIRLQLVGDKFAPIRKVWEIFVQKCRENYIPGPYLTVDEQLLAFRGKCGFRMYIPNKPAKYGLKMVMLCDSGTKYMVDAIPYLGKNSNTTNMPLGEFYVKELTKTVHGSNRNITMDNWFTSIPLAQSLGKSPYKLTIVGTLRSNKREIPAELKNKKGRKCGTSMFCYDNNLTLLSYKPKPSKMVYLLSSCNEEGSINPSTNKPTMVDFYNSTKGGVDTFDQMCSVMSCSRKTNRWPMCQFFGILNIAFINSYIIYSHNMFQDRQKPLNRVQYMKNLFASLTRSQLNDRLDIPTISTIVRNDIQTELAVNNSTDAENGVPIQGVRKRKICAVCPSSKRRMTNVVCAKCNKRLCGEHKIEVCASCLK